MCCIYPEETATKIYIESIIVDKKDNFHIRYILLKCRRFNKMSQILPQIDKLFIYSSLIEDFPVSGHELRHFVKSATFS
jgi:hypothetical protein